MKQETKINTGGEAFPRTCDTYSQGSSGMTLRDYFAGQALSGLCCGFDKGAIPLVQLKQIAEDCYLMADAMLASRE